MKTFFQLFFLCFTAQAQAQNFNIVADSLRVPLGLHAAADGNMWVSEVGYGFNDGTVSVLRPDGSMTPVIVGLPSFFDTTVQEIVGAWRSAPLPSGRLGVVSPISGGILVFDLNGFVPGLTPPISAASSTTQIPISDFVFQNQPSNAPDSNPYSFALDESGNLYVVDSGFNGIVKVDAATGQRSVFATFSGFPNPLPFGPPMVDPVPTRILNKPGGGFYVCTLTGFPFLEGAASIFSVDMNGQVTPFATGFTLLTDLALDANTGDLYALQFGTFVLDPVMPGYAPGSAKVTRIKPDGSQQTVAQGFGPAAGIALDGTGDLYISSIFDGLLLKLENVATSTQEQANGVSLVALVPNPTSGATRISFSLQRSAEASVRVLDLRGQSVFSQQLGKLPAGPSEVHWNATGLPSGLYIVEIQSGTMRAQKKVVLR